MLLFYGRETCCYSTFVRCVWHDDAGLAVESLDLVEPTLDDVFVAKTGRHLEVEGGDPPVAEQA